MSDCYFFRTDFLMHHILEEYRNSLALFIEMDSKHSLNYNKGFHDLCYRKYFISSKDPYLYFIE